ncbi:MAG: hypothetical protein A2015_08535 [Spirochaetes bacterium GWF1_31_7]|nr:MAG: hypothetical protein A2Y30_07125 [Spirochaetes bacterium GWE1_32_154]OHD47970.1 MAG: hypothetical protein A2015_08535 [Spirochaetes bacterium GWF1_31_7]OHD48061.1 MAG: hypothetical protein A2Y29_07870 [Spirochaetes bacterium GWE2_31_10]OHD78660.1 MAG: hypothetical protein A2355_16915 [Spirochaetes bacterium RIFOXYB1_FULL_32_8]HBD94090.1 hypothetical protein [Spirochaetia bacterium]
MQLTHDIVDGYFDLMKNLDNHTKIELISKLSSSILENDKKKESLLLSSFGQFISDLSADELYNEIRSSRHFRNKNIIL